MSDFRLGLHAPVQGATTRFHQTAAALGAGSILWLPSEQPSDSSRFRSALHVVRLDNWHVGEDPGSYASRCAGRINAWFAVPNVVFQCGNEPELDEHPPHHGEAFPLYASRLRSMWHGIKLANPPLQAEHTRLWDEAIICAGDYLACHCYWQINHAHDIENPNLGGAYKQLLHLDKPVIVTEVNAVPASGVAADTNVDWYERNAQVALWAASADLAGTHACCIFIADASADWAGFSISAKDAEQIRAQYDAYVDDSGEEEEIPVDQGDVYGEDLLAMFESQIGHPKSGDYDLRNGYDHPWAYFCQAGVESTGRQCGLVVNAQDSATSAAGWAEQRGILNTDDSPEHGAVISLGPSFYYPYGHTGYWNADRQQLLGTQTNGTGVGYNGWGPSTNGYLGWYRLPGVVAPRRDSTPEPPPPSSYVPPNNPYAAADGREIGLGGGFLRMWNSIAIGIDPLVVLGYPMNNEETATVTDGDQSQARTVQRFERGSMIYQPEYAFPSDVVVALLSSVITGS